MSVTITITDPTKEEALRVADYLYDLAGYGKAAATLSETVADPEHAAVKHSDDAPGVSIDTAQVFAAGSDYKPSDVVTMGGVGSCSTQELDSAGLPWDARIHASSRAKIADGTWRMKRGVDDATVAAVTAELKGAAPVSGVEKEIDAPQPTANAQLVAPPPPPPADTALTFPTLLQRVTAAKIAPETVLQAVQAQGLPSLPMLATRPDLLPAVAAALGV